MSAGLALSALQLPFPLELLSRSGIGLQLAEVVCDRDVWVGEDQADIMFCVVSSPNRLVMALLSRLFMV